MGRLMGSTDGVERWDIAHHLTDGRPTPEVLDFSNSLGVRRGKQIVVSFSVDEIMA